MSSILFPLVFNIFVFYIVRFNPPIEWPPSEQILWFGIFRLKDVIRGLSLLFVVFSAPRGYSPGIPVFPLFKNQHFQIPILAWKVSPISAKALEDIDTKIK